MKKEAKLDMSAATEDTAGDHDLKTRNDTVAQAPSTDDILHPLNWPARKKYLVFAVICLAAFSGLASIVAQNSNLVVQAKTYQISPTEMSYASTTAVAGLMVGPIIIVPFARVLGVSSIIFWSVFGNIICAIWAACMTGKDDYIGFVMSRLFAGLFGAIPQILGNGVIQNMFARHQRGRAFAIYSTSYTLGTVASPTFGGFIIQHVFWPVTLWWIVALNGLVLILIFALVHETGYDSDNPPDLTKGFVADRLATFFPGHRMVPALSRTEFLHLYISPFQIFISPATILAGIYQLTTFGWFVMINTLLAIYLQTPVMEGGYGFSPQQNAAFLFSLWIGVLAAQLYGNTLNDRVPHYLWRRKGGPQLPEYRLHTLWFPGLFVMPVGCGLFGAALQYHLHYMVLALGAFFIAFGGVTSVPVPINYLVESYKNNPQEVGTVMNFYRLLLGLVVPFFVEAWTEAVGVGWVFGMAAFFSVATFGGIVLLMWKGEAIRARSLGHVAAIDQAGL